MMRGGPDGRRRLPTAVLAVAMLVLAGAASGCGGAHDSTAGDAAPTEVAVEATTAALEPALTDATPSDDPTPSAAPSRATAHPAPSRSSRPKPRRATAPKPRAKPAPRTEAKLPPPPPKPVPGCTPVHRGVKASHAQARDALTAAAGRTYWPGSAPGLKLSTNLVKAVAWQESGWQSDIVACDGGVGLMQVMKDTATFVNNRFEQSYDINDYRDNATLGANYLAWLTKYIGDLYFDGDYSLDAANCATELNSCLLNAVIAAYNFGPGAVATDNGLVIPNPGYVRNVRALMTECVCLSY
ncbi:lytic transglycosylase domain-containing protein [Plantactinospora siamensis]|uniref:Lytic transglycosylase domain-containing protein n=1 Tax=Plantactinospora siamensis TaxID=555372 RepID=A0ABV6P0R4_9ACTN